MSTTNPQSTTRSPDEGNSRLSSDDLEQVAGGGIPTGHPSGKRPVSLPTGPVAFGGTLIEGSNI